MKNSYPFLLEDALESTSKEAFSDHPLKNRERLELKKYLGKLKIIKKEQLLGFHLRHPIKFVKSDILYL